MPYFNLRSDFITVFLHNNLAKLQLLVIIRDGVRVSDRPQQAQDVNAVLSCTDYFTLVVDRGLIYRMVCYFHERSNHSFNLSEAI